MLQRNSCYLASARTWSARNRSPARGWERGGRIFRRSLLATIKYESILDGRLRLQAGKGAAVDGMKKIKEPSQHEGSFFIS